MNLQSVLKFLVLAALLTTGNLYAKDMLYKCPKFANSSIKKYSRKDDPAYSKKPWAITHILDAAVGAYRNNILELKKIGILRCNAQLTLNRDRCWEISLSAQGSPYKIDEGTVYSQSINAKPVVKKIIETRVRRLLKTNLHFQMLGKLKDNKFLAPPKYELGLKVLNCRPIEYISQADKKTRADLDYTIEDLEHNYHQQDVNMQNIEILQNEIKALRQEIQILKGH